jgi:hypothetical protein
MGLDWLNGHSNTETFAYIFDKMRVGITSNKSIVKDDEADEDAVKGGENHKKPVERGFELLTGQNAHREGVSKKSKYSSAKL